MKDEEVMPTSSIDIRKIEAEYQKDQAEKNQKEATTNPSWLGDTDTIDEEVSSPTIAFAFNYINVCWYSYWNFMFIKCYTAT